MPVPNTGFTSTPEVVLWAFQRMRSEKKITKNALGMPFWG
jgi:hypothetical protein